MNPATLIALLVSVPFTEPPAVTLEDPADLTVEALYGDESALPFADDEGYVYARRTRHGLRLAQDGRCVPQDHPDATDNRSCDAIRACWHPSNPEGTLRYLFMNVDVAASQAAVHDGLAVWDAGLFALAEHDGRQRARVFRCTTDGFAPETALRTNTGDAISFPPLSHRPFVLGRRVCGFWNPEYFSGNPERLELACLVRPEDFRVHSSGAPLFSGQTVLALDDLDAHFGIPPLAPNADGTPAKVIDQNQIPQDVHERWFASPGTATTPDGRTYLTVVRRSAATQGQDPGRYQATRWLVSLPPDADDIDDLTLEYGPRWPLRKAWPYGLNPELELGRPVYDSAADILIFEAYGQEFGNRRFTICNSFGDCQYDVPRGTYGDVSRGFWVLKGRRIGYVSATDAFYGTARSYVQPASTSVEGATLIQLGDQLAWLFASPGTPPMTRLIRFHPEHFDLDEDGLTAAEEDALGTSDLDPNSDDDYVNDRVERDLGFDPTDPSEAPIRADDFGATAVTTSALIQRRFAIDRGLVRSHAPDGPLCVTNGVCYDTTGLPVATFPPSPGTRALAHDGRHLVTFDDGVIEALDLFTQERHLIGTATDGDFIFPLNERVVFLARMSPPAIWVIEDGERRLLFDLDQAAHLAGFTTPPNSIVETMGLSPEHFQVLGFLAAPAKSTDLTELVIAVQGHWRRYVIGLRKDGTTREILRTRTDGLGDIDTSAEWLGGLYLDGPILAADGGYLAPPGLRLFTGDTFADRPVPALGALFVENRALPEQLVQPQQAGLHELVAFQPALSPGETLVFISRWAGVADHLGFDVAISQTYDHPGMLFRVGLRGGMVPAWSLAPADFDYSFVEVTGMDLDRRHYLCMADRGQGELRVYRPTQSGDIPTVLDERFAVPGITDCRWRPDGLSLAANGHTWTRPATALKHTLAAFVDDDLPAHAFVKGPGVDLEAAAPGTAAFVAGPGADYARVSYDGKTLTTPWGRLALASAGKTPPTVALRPDGRVVMAPDIVYDDPRSEPLVIADPSTPAQPTTYVALGDGGRGHGYAVAVAPWDHLADPWTGRPLDPADPFAAPSARPTFPTPTAPSAGAPIDPQPPRPTPGGCSGPPTLWLPLALLVLARRRADDKKFQFISKR